MSKQPNLSYPQNVADTNNEVGRLLCVINMGGGEELLEIGFSEDNHD
jgi:hypothetical protein